MSNDELQKAIDDITSGENAAAPVAQSAAEVKMPAEMGSAPVASAEPALSFEEVPIDPAFEAPKPIISEAPAAEAPVETPVAEAPVEAPVEAPAETPVVETPAEAPVEMSENVDIESVKKDALKELYPLLNKLNVSPKEKYDICIKVIENGDKGAAQAALTAAKEITDDVEKGEALMNLVEKIGTM